MALLRYTVLRALILAIVAALLWIVGLRGLWMVLWALLVSGVVSLFALNRSRDAVSAALVRRSEEIRQRLDEQAAAEDDWDEARRLPRDDAPDGGS